MSKKAMLNKTMAVIMSAAIMMTGTGVSALAQTGEIQEETGTAAEVETPETVEEAQEQAQAPEETEETVSGDTVAAAETTQESGDADSTSVETVEETEIAADSEPSYEEEELTAEHGRSLTDAQLNDKVSDRYITDATLRTALLNIYNAENAANPKNANTFTMGDLQKVQNIDLSNGATATHQITPSDIKSVEGLGYAKGMTYLDISQVGGLSLTDAKAVPQDEFGGENSLTTIVLADEVTRIGYGAFSDCSALQHIWIRKSGTVDESVNTLPSNLSDSGSGTTDEKMANVFSGCTALESIVIPDLKNVNGLTRYIGMFSGCTGLTSIQISKDVAVLPNGFFQNLKRAKKNNSDVIDEVVVTVDPGSQLTTIGGSCFQYSNVKTIDLSFCSKLTLIDANAFNADKSSATKANLCDYPLESIKLPKTITGTMEIGKNAFFRTKVSSLYTDDADIGNVIMPTYVSSIGAGAFYQDTEMTTLVLSPALKEIPTSCFDGCSKLADISIPAGSTPETTVIWDAAFRGTAVTSANFIQQMSKLTTFGKHSGEYDAAKGKPQLAEISIADVKNEDSSKIQNYAYTYTYTEPVKVDKAIRSEVFSGDKLLSIAFPASLRTIEQFALWNLPSLKTVTWDGGSAPAAKNATYVIDDGAFAWDKALTEIQLPKTDDTDNKTSLTVGRAAFLQCEKLTKVYRTGDTFSKSYLPKALKSLGTSAFAKCKSLANMDISDSSYVESGKVYPQLNIRTFEYSTSLATATLPNNATVIPDSFYYDCALTNLPGNPAKITKIENRAFLGNRIPQISFVGWNVLTELGDYAFAYYDPINNNYYADEYSETLSEFMTKKFTFPDEPQCAQHYISFGTGLFESDYKLDTIATQKYNTDKVVYMPHWMYPGRCGADLFCDTGVSKVVWIYSLPGENVPTVEEIWRQIPTGTFYMCENIKNIRDVLPGGQYLAKVTHFGNHCFGYCLGLTTVDLRSGNSGFAELEEFGVGVFSNCLNLEELYLPDNGICTKISDEMFHIGIDSKLAGIGMNPPYSSLTKIDFGKVTTIGKDAFSVYNLKQGTGTSPYNKAGLIFPSKLEKLVLKPSVKTLGVNSFQGRGIGSNEDEIYNTEALAEFKRLREITWAVPTAADIAAGYTGLNEISTSAFARCTELRLTGNAFPDSLQIIGDSAFEGCSSLGSVAFGKGIGSIGNKAFYKASEIKTVDKKNVMTENTGLVAVDFTNATDLKFIGTSAFEQTSIKSFDISKTKTANLESGTVASCPYLTEITLNKSLQLMKANSAYGCIKLKTVKIDAKSTLNKQAFKNGGVFADENGSVLTPISDGFNIIVNSDEVKMGVGGQMWFPFNIREYDPSDSASMPVRVGTTSDTDTTMKEYFKITTQEKYYEFQMNSAHEIKDSRYYQQATVDADKFRKINGVNQVAGFKIEGLKKTPAAGIPLFVVNYFRLEQGSTTAEVQFDARFIVKVMDIEYYPVFYMDGKRDNLNTQITMANRGAGKMGSGTTTINLCKDDPSGVQNVYYNLENREDSVWLPAGKGMTVIAKSSNPAVMEVGGAGGAYGKKADGKTPDKSYYEIAPVENAETVAALINNKMLTFTPISTGDATITVYLAGYPENKITWNFHIFADVQTGGIRLSVPREQLLKGGFRPGDTFNILESLSFYKKGALKRDAIKDEEKLNLAAISKFSKSVMSFTSDNPSCATIDQAGNVTIHAASDAGYTVNFEAKAKNPVGESVIVALILTVKYPVLAKNAAVENPASGGTFVVSQAADASGKGGTVTFTGVVEGAKTVTIPDTVTDCGKTFKVTAIAPNAFKDNKTVQSVTIGKNVKVLPAGLFTDCTALKSVVIKGKVKDIPVGFFSGCKKLTSVTLPTSVKTIGDNAFLNCKALTKITIPKNVTAIGRAAFKGCKKLSKVTFKKGSKLKTIGDEAFSGCAVLKTLSIISTKLTTIGGSAFYKCKKLKKIVIKSSKVTAVGVNAFKSIYKKAVIQVPKKKVSAYKTLFAGKGQGKKVKIKK